MSDILHRIRTQAPLDRVLAAITTEKGLKTWWTDDTTAQPEPGFVNIFRFVGGTVEFHFKVDEIGNKRVAWTCLRGDKVPEEWVGTHAAFDLEPTEDGGTLIDFAHRDWKSAEGEFATCNTVWGELMHRLRDCAEGKPTRPYFVRAG